MKINQLNSPKKLTSENKLIREMIEPLRAIESELCDIAIRKEVIHKYHGAYFSCAKI